MDLRKLATLQKFQTFWFQQNNCMENELLILSVKSQSVPINFKIFIFYHFFFFFFRVTAPSKITNQITISTDKTQVFHFLSFLLLFSLE